MSFFDTLAEMLVLLFAMALGFAANRLRRTGRFPGCCFA